MDKLRSRVGDPTARLARLLTAFRVAWAGALVARPNAERGQGLAEYSLIVAFIAITAIAALVFFGQELVGVFWDPITTEIGKVIDLVLGP